MRLHLFLVSSPLQVIVVDHIRRQYLQASEDQCVVFCEGERLAKLLHEQNWHKIVVGKNTRPSIEKASTNIHYNLKLLADELSVRQSTKIILYVSELFWLFNNVVFSWLKKKWDKFECNFFDEGMVMYQARQFSVKEKVKSCLKYLWLKQHGFPATLILNGIQVVDQRAQKIYCYHPKLLLKRIKQPELSEKLLPLNASDTDFLQDPMLKKFHKKAALVLSQPYYRIMRRTDYEKIISRMADQLRQQGYEHIFIKPHDADCSDWIEQLVKKYQFILFKPKETVPIEWYAGHLNCGAVVSICSSALLNLKLFQYKGEVISFGMRSFNYSPNVQRSHEYARQLYEELGVTIIDG